MPRRRRTPILPPASFPEDFPQRLEAFKKASGLSWREMAFRLGVEPRFLRRWRSGVHPSGEHLLNLINLAEEFSLDHVLTGRTRRNDPPPKPDAIG